MKKLFSVKYIDLSDGKQELGWFIADDTNYKETFFNMVNRFGIKIEDPFFECVHFVSGHEVVLFDESFKRAVRGLKRTKTPKRSKEYRRGYLAALRGLQRLVV